LNCIHKKSDNDIQEIVDLKKQLRASDQRFFNVTGKNLEGIVVVNCRFEIVYVNHAAEKVFGRNSGELLGEDFGLPLEVGHISDFRIFNPKSGVVFVEILVNHIEWEDEAAYLVIFRDVTERKKTEDFLKRQTQDLERSNKELDSFAYTVSHDIRGPVRSMSAFAAFIQEDCSERLDDQSKNYLERIVKSGKKVQVMIDDILEFSRIGRIEKKKVRVNIKEIVEEVLVLLSKDILDLNAVIQLGDEFPIWDCHKNRISQVILNFVSNSLKYVVQGQKPEVMIGMAKRKGRQWVYVKDNGIGIKAESFTKVFEVFGRLHPNNQTYEGSGIGLGTVKKIIDTHGGELFIESEEGLGSTFFFTLEAKEKERGEPEKKKIGKILLEAKVINETQLQAALAKQSGVAPKNDMDSL